MNNFDKKKKHFRYKKRISFLTKDKLFRIDLSVIKSTRFINGKYDFQIVERDFAFIVDKNVRAGDLVSVIKKTNEIIKSVDVFDLYEGENIDEDKKSVALKVLFEPTDKTLNDKEIDELSDKIILAAKSLGGSLRSQ